MFAYSFQNYLYNKGKLRKSQVPEEPENFQ